MLGIVSVALCGVGLVTGIIALVLAKKSLAQYALNPSLYNTSSRDQLKAGRVCAIIGVSLSGLLILFYVIYFGFIFSMVAAAAAAS